MLSDKVSENIHGHKKLPLPNHLEVLDMYLETADTKQKKMHYRFVPFAAYLSTTAWQIMLSTFKFYWYEEELQMKICKRLVKN